MRTRARRETSLREAGYIYETWKSIVDEREKDEERRNERKKERDRELEWSVLGVAGRLIERGFPWARVDIRANEAFPRKPGGGLSCGEGLRHQWGC